MHAPLFHLHQRDIWVFGGAGYLGRPVVTQLLAMGARVLCVDMEERATHAVAESGWNDQVTPASLNVNEVDEATRFVESQLAARGTPHGLVVMTFQSTARRLDELGAAEFDAANHGNLTATFCLARPVGAAMARQGRGSMVLFSSMYGSVSPDPRVYKEPMTPNPIEYGVGKAGVQQMARYFGVHHGPHGVRCNSISPGPFPNPKVQVDHPDFVSRLASRVPMGRVGHASEIAGAVVFLLSDASSFITGQNLAVDGGWTAW